MKRKAQQASKPAAKRGKKDVAGSVKTALENYGKAQQEQQEQLFLNSKALRLNEENRLHAYKIISSMFQRRLE
jgi:hypothetical protein